MIQTEESAAVREEVQTLRQQLLQAQRLCSLGALATSVTHEFNNILTAISNHAKLGLNNTDGAARTKSLEKIMLAAERAAKITKGMLGLARAGSTERKLTDMVELVREVLVLVEKDLSKHRVRLETRFRGRPQAVVFACQIQQILLNLIINARQAMPRGGNLLVEVRENAEANMAEIVVADVGVGIPPEKLRHIFEPFFTTKSGPDETGKGGTGLGLAICRDIIEAHSGRIRVESLVGRGTTFTVKLPAASGTQQAVA